jgi:hypothetical protein
MEDQKKNSSVVSRLWSNWVNLDPQQRNAVAQNLGPMGQVLTIAANVHQFVNNTQRDVDLNQNQPENAQYSNTSSQPDIDADSDIIDVEFEEEVDP